MDYYIVSVCHTQRQHQYVTLWRPDNKGYAWPLAWAGKYDHEAVLADLGYYNSGCANIAVRADVIEALAIPPKPGTIDNDAGPVVMNNAANWRAMLKALIQKPRHEPRPEYRGARHYKEAA